MPGNGINFVLDTVNLDKSTSPLNSETQAGIKIIDFFYDYAIKLYLNFRDYIHDVLNIFQRICSFYKVIVC